MDAQLKVISRAGIAEAIAKAELYRYLNEPEEAESICRDILSVDSGHQLARRLLGLSITDQFTGYAGDRYTEVEEIFKSLRDRVRTRPTTPGFCTNAAPRCSSAAAIPRTFCCRSSKQAMKCFAEAEKIRPARKR